MEVAATMYKQLANSLVWILSYQISWLILSTWRNWLMRVLAAEVHPGDYWSEKGWNTVRCFCVCNSSALLRDLLRVSRSMEYDFLSVLSYPGFFLSVSCTTLSSNRNVFSSCYCSSAFLRSLCWFCCQYLLSDWLERLLWGRLIESWRLSVQRPGRRALLCLFGLVCFLLCVCSRLYTIYCIYLWHNMAYLCWVPLSTNQRTLHSTSRWNSSQLAKLCWRWHHWTNINSPITACDCSTNYKTN